MAVLEGQKMLDTGEDGPYATSSMRTPSSPTMLARATPVQIWTERGDYEDAGEEEGQGQEEEVRRPREKGERTHRSPVFFRELTATARRQITPER